MIENYKKYLVVVAHPDDETLGCGGTLKKLTKLKKNVKVIFIAEGTSCRFKKPFDKEKVQELILKRKKMAISALKELGVKRHHFYDLECGKLKSLPPIMIAKIIEKEIKLFQPEILITHSNYDVNTDHKSIYQACLQSSRPTKKGKVIKGLLSFEILSSTEWKYNKVFEPNIFINIEKEINFKIKALKKYTSEICKFPHPRSVEGIKSLAKYRGMQSSLRFSEAFKLIRLFS